MKKSYLPVIVLLALISATGCHIRVRGKKPVPPPAVTAAVPLTPQEELAQQAIDLLDEASGLMALATDRVSAAKVAPKLKVIAQKLQDLNRRGVPLGSEIREQRQALGRLDGDMEKAVQRYADAGVRLLVRENNLGTEIQEALRDFGKLPP